MKVTILTPTYNRAYTLEKLYNSLISQTCKDFEWLIIDDGSTDDTKQLIENFQKEDKINIRFFIQQNGGKHRALNNGIKKIKNELTFFVDSDDWLEKDAVETIIKYGVKYQNFQNIAVLSFLKAYPNKKVNGPKYYKNEYIGNYMEDRLNKKNWGDKAEVCYTEKLKKFPLLEIENEKFISEGYLWAKMGLEYDTVFINKIIYIADYLQDGLTKNIYKIRYNNPKGCVEVAKLICNKKAKLMVKIKSMIKYIGYSRIAKITLHEQFNRANYKLIFMLCYIPGIVFEQYVKNKVRKQ